MSNDFNDYRATHRQCCRFNTQANIFLHKFNMCSVHITCTLFTAFCTPVYTARLWYNHRKKSSWRPSGLKMIQLQ